MRGLLALCFLALGLLTDGIAFAQPARRPDAAAPAAEKSAEDMQAIKERVADWLRTCLADWDQATHMTKNEWRVTCQRVATDRGKFLAENPGAAPGSMRGRQQQSR
jgi:hypothetical protein